MAETRQLVATFILNAIWQITAIAALTFLCARLLHRAPSRFAHGIWIAALGACLLIPTATVVLQHRGATGRASELAPTGSTRTGGGTERPSDSGVTPFAQPFAFILSQDSLRAALGVRHCSAFSCCSACLVRLSDAACMSVGLPVSIVACSCADRGALCVSGKHA